ncbi:MAG: hypothetical protein DWQ47_13305 [Acidobacteria bacterium]|nr:MAG: hypothetical protein DWQ32_00705 [Acidobacteriota bacterium]REK02944.1 MAG: hypothetical protein DWQ38_11430 [Acidobacteriota bacterium]REK13252.1 MAG: hypothetical protein DWQ43_06395 [Acidobacteriota bacterium]REK41246.1 MAG: hypothetical protein DWQ47_13305 [Acidobacteriota bacterium]
MKNITQFIVRALACLVVITIGSYVIAAQNTITGTWKASTEVSKKVKEKTDHATGDHDFEWNDGKSDIQITFRYSTSEGGNNSQGTGFSFDDLEGLTKAQAEGISRAVNFRISREAGVIECTGTFENGRGSGTFTFVPNASFRSAMEQRGFKFSDKKMLAATTLDVTVALADDLSASGFNDLDTDDLFKAKIFKVDSNFMREMAATGFPNLDMEDLVKARIFKIDANFVRDVVSMGFQTKSFEELVKFRIFKITPEFLRDMQNAGFQDLNSEQAVKLRIFKVTPDFIRQMQGEGLSSLSVEEAVKLRIFNVSADFIRDARANGATDLSVEALVKMKIHGKVND